MQVDRRMKNIFLLFLISFFGTTQNAKAETKMSLLGALTYLKVPAGSIGFGGGLAVEELMTPDFGIETGAIYIERSLKAGGKKFSFHTFHVPLMVKYYINSEYFLGLGYSADLSVENRALIYGPKISIGMVTPATLDWIGLSNTNWVIDLQYTQDQSHQATYKTVLTTWGIRF